MWAIQDYGFHAVISPRFADIFRNNCTKNGLVPVVASTPRSGERCSRAIEADPTLEITVDVERRSSRPRPSASRPRSRSTPSTQHRFLEGLDDIGITLQSADDIATFEATRPAHLPQVTA